MGFNDVNQGAAASFFLVVYALFACCLAAAFYFRRPRKRIIGLAFFVAVRMASQVAGICFAISGFGNFRWLIAYLVLGAEGFFVLILSAIFMLAAYQTEILGSSWMTQKKPENLTRRQCLRHIVSSPSFWFHQALIPGNTLVIIGGTKQSNKSGYSATEFTSNPDVQEGKTVRTVGQALFLVNLVFALACIVHTLIQARKRGANIRPLLFLVAIAPFMLVRSAFGLLSSASFSYSYYDPGNYTIHGIGSKLLVAEYVMGTLPEFISACLIFTTGWILSHPRGKAVSKEEDLGRETSNGPGYDTKWSESKAKQ